MRNEGVRNRMKLDMLGDGHNQRTEYYDTPVPGNHIFMDLIVVYTHKYLNSGGISSTDVGQELPHLLLELSHRRPKIVQRHAEILVLSPCPKLVFHFF